MDEFVKKKRQEKIKVWYLIMSFKSFLLSLKDEFFKSFLLFYIFSLTDFILDISLHCFISFFLFFLIKTCTAGYYFYAKPTLQVSNIQKSISNLFAQHSLLCSLSPFGSLKTIKMFISKLTFYRFIIKKIFALFFLTYP